VDGTTAKLLAIAQPGKLYDLLRELTKVPGLPNDGWSLLFKNDKMAVRLAAIELLCSMETSVLRSIVTGTLDPHRQGPIKQLQPRSQDEKCSSIYLNCFVNSSGKGPVHAKASSTSVERDAPAQRRQGVISQGNRDRAAVHELLQKQVAALTPEDAALKNEVARLSRGAGPTLSQFSTSTSSLTPTPTSLQYSIAEEAIFDSRSPLPVSPSPAPWGASHTADDDNLSVAESTASSVAAVSDVGSAIVASQSFSSTPTHHNDWLFDVQFLAEGTLLDGARLELWELDSKAVELLKERLVHFKERHRLSGPWPETKDIVCLNSRLHKYSAKMAKPLVNRRNPSQACSFCSDHQLPCIVSMGPRPIVLHTADTPPPNRPDTGSKTTRPSRPRRMSHRRMSHSPDERKGRQCKCWIRSKNRKSKAS
jgi:hypothetical protein